MAKKFLISLIVILLPIFAKEIKIGYIDSQKILAEYKATAEQKKIFDQEVQNYKDRASEMQKKVAQLKSELESQKLVLSEAARATKMEEIERLTKQYEDFVQQVWGPQGKIEEKNAELMAPLIKKINEVVETIAKGEGFTMILDISQGGIVYAQEGLNITDDVIKELNKEYEPVVITPTKRKTIAIFPLFEGNSEAKEKDLGDLCQTYLYSATKLLPKYDYIRSFQVKNALLRRGLTKNVEERVCIEIGRELAADYIIVGTVNKTGNKIDFELKMIETRSEKEMNKSSDSAEDLEQKLQEKLGDTLKRLLAKLTE